MHGGAWTGRKARGLFGRASALPLAASGFTAARRRSPGRARPLPIWPNRKIALCRAAPAGDAGAGWRAIFMKLPRELGPIHFVGIGGIGMSGIAEMLLNQGYRV